jgi:hypothetical protein
MKMDEVNYIVSYYDNGINPDDFHLPLKTPESPWKLPENRLRATPPENLEWCADFFEDEIPLGYRPLLKNEYPKKGDYHRNNPNISTKQIWYKFFIDQKEWKGKAITSRPY